MIYSMGKCLFCKKEPTHLSVPGCCESCYSERLPNLLKGWAWQPELPQRPQLITKAKKKRLPEPVTILGKEFAGSGYVYLLRTIDAPIEYKTECPSLR